MVIYVLEEVKRMILSVDICVLEESIDIYVLEEAKRMVLSVGIWRLQHFWVVYMPEIFLKSSCA